MPPATFAEAKSVADTLENNLTAIEMTRLLDAQGGIAGTAFPHCIDSTGLAPPEFTVVFAIAADGRVTRSWQDLPAPFQTCFAKQMQRDFVFVPPTLPFYTSFEYQNAP